MIRNVLQKPCLDTEWYTEVVVNTENPEQTEFFIVTLPNTIGSNTLRRTTPPVKGDQGGSYKALVHHACLDKQSEHVLVILDSTGKGLSSASAQGSWALKLDGKKKPTPTKNFKYIRTFRFGPKRTCFSVGFKLFSLLLRTDDYPEETSWKLTKEIDATVAVASGSGYTKGLSLYEICTFDYGKLHFTIEDEGGDGLCCNHGVGFFVAFYDGEPFLNGAKFGKKYDFMIPKP